MARAPERMDGTSINEPPKEYGILAFIKSLFSCKCSCKSSCKK